MDPGARAVLIALSSIALCGAVLHWVHQKSLAPMDFIERHLGFSTDHGYGSLEVTLLTVLFMIIAAVGFRLASK
jgi:hypothetical protein